MFAQRAAEPGAGLRIVLDAVNSNHRPGRLAGHRHRDLVRHGRVRHVDRAIQSAGAVEDRRAPDRDRRPQIAFDRHRVESQLAARRQHAVDDHPRRPHAFGPRDLDPLPRLVQPAEIRLFGKQFVERLRCADVREVAVENRTPERLPRQYRVQLPRGGFRVRVGAPLAGQGHGEMAVQVQERRRLPGGGAQPAEPPGDLRIEPDQPAVHGHHSPGEYASGSRDLGRGGLLQEGVHPAAGIGHVNPVLRSDFGRLPQSDAGHARPRPVELARVKREHHVAGSHHQARGEPFGPTAGKRQELIEHGADVAPRSLDRKRAEQLAGERVLRQPARVAAGMDDQNARVPPTARQRPERAQSVQGRAAAADPAVAGIGNRQVQRLRDLVLALPPPDLVHVQFGLSLRTRGKDDGVPPRRPPGVPADAFGVSPARVERNRGKRHVGHHPAYRGVRYRRHSPTGRTFQAAVTNTRPGRQARSLLRTIISTSWLDVILTGA